MGGTPDILAAWNCRNSEKFRSWLCWGDLKYQPHFHTSMPIASPLVVSLLKLKAVNFGEMKKENLTFRVTCFISWVLIRALFKTYVKLLLRPKWFKGMRSEKLLLCWFSPFEVPFNTYYFQQHYNRIELALYSKLKDKLW